MTLEIFMSGVGVACAIATTGFLLALGWHGGIIAGAWLFGPHRTTNNYNVNLRGDAASSEGEKK